MLITENELRNIIRRKLIEQAILDEGKKWDAIKSGAKSIVKKAYQTGGLGALVLQSLIGSPVHGKTAEQPLYDQPLYDQPLYIGMQKEIKRIKNKSNQISIAEAIVILTKYYREGMNITDIPDHDYGEIEAALNLINERCPKISNYLDQLAKNPKHQSGSGSGFDSASEVLSFDKDLSQRVNTNDNLKVAKRKFSGEHILINKYINPQDEHTKKEARFFEVYKKNRVKQHKIKQEMIKTQTVSKKIKKQWGTFQPFNKKGIFVYYPFGYEGEPRFLDSENWKDRRTLDDFVNIGPEKTEQYEMLDGDQFGRKFSK